MDECGSITSNIRVRLMWVLWRDKAALPCLIRRIRLLCRNKSAAMEVAHSHARDFCLLFASWSEKRCGEGREIVIVGFGMAKLGMSKRGGCGCFFVINRVRIGTVDLFGGLRRRWKKKHDCWLLGIGSMQVLIGGGEG